ncbi:GAF domain-containing protein [Streptomyces rhizosphaerihabitans]|uniref:GAF domain-containing protein n=1 Tax=Streptomyces rhizosphaerihabitans TaxID=1266770 RepID=UPI0021BE6FE1|nr:GAF domain-containing protein [Streptomyces rhizosphaerihabitans]MCT9006123.1 GAF domain-containing protein [Streptomyces rhizosphaerihabitans]
MEGQDLALLLGAGSAENGRAHRLLLQSIAETTRAACVAQACSIQRLDIARREFVFEAVAGQGEDSMIGRRYPSDRGIAGWTLLSRQSIVVDDVSVEPSFAKDVAESTGYVPRSIVAFPLIKDDAPVGVMEVLDYELDEERGIGCLEFVAPFAGQASIVLQLVERDRTVGEAVEADAELRELAALTSAFSALSEEKRQTAVRLLRLIRELM